MNRRQCCSKRVRAWMFFTVLVLGASQSSLAASDFRWPNLKSGDKFPADGDWAQIKKKFQDEQKVQEALALLEKHLAIPSTQKDPVDWARSLIWKSNFQAALGQAEAAVDNLRHAEWPKADAPQFVLRLYLIEALNAYLGTYGYEIRQREKIATTSKLELKKLTYEQIVSELRSSYLALWKDREKMSTVPVGAIEEFVAKNTYPRNIRSTLRDFLTYSYVKSLSDSSHWSPEESAQKDDLDMRTLINLPTRLANAESGTSKKHPIEWALALLGDLRSWHQDKKNREGMLQTLIESYSFLQMHFTGASDQSEIASKFEASLERFKDVPWYSWGVYVLAGIIRNSGEEGALVRARALALLGANAYPKEEGARNCGELVKSIESPSFTVSLREADGAKHRSLEVSHKNLTKIYLKYYAYDMDEFLDSPTAFNFGYLDSDVNAQKRYRTFLDKHKLIRSYTLTLPETPDYQTHRSFFVATDLPDGSYVVFASAEPSFASTGNLLYSTHYSQSNLFFARTTGADTGETEFRVYRGDFGDPVSDAKITLWKPDYSQQQMRWVKLKTLGTNSEGVAILNFGALNDRVMAVIQKSDELTHTDQFWNGSYRSDFEKSVAGMMFSDRGAYRPGQKILWKLLLYRGGETYKDYKVAPSTPFEINLVDINGQKVAIKSGTTNSFGTASGFFEIPTGRALGQWSMHAIVKNGPGDQLATKWIRVEEYKRPTFFAEFVPPKDSLRLNAKAKLEGQVKYYFGSPVTDGKVKWRVTRSPRMPSWWGWWGRFCGGFFWQDVSRTVVVASGEAKLRDDGGFSVEFVPAAKESREAIENELGFDFGVTADVTDAGGETRSTSTSHTLFFTDRQIRFDDMKTEYIDAKQIEVATQLSTTTGAGVAGKGLLRLVRLAAPNDPLMPSEEKLYPESLKKFTQGLKTPGDLLRNRLESSPYLNIAQTLALWSAREEVNKVEVVHDAKGAAKTVFGDLTPGTYRLVYEAKDTRGNPIKASRDFVVLSKQASAPLPLVVVGPSEAVFVGKTARLFVDSGFKDPQIVVEIKKDRKMRRRVSWNLAKDGRVVEIPIGEEDRGGLSYRVALVRKHELLVATGNINVPYENRELKLSWQRFRDTLRPNTKETWTLKVEETDKTGQASSLKKSVEALVSAYDQSLDVFQSNSHQSANQVLPGESGFQTLTSFVRASESQSLEASNHGPYNYSPGYTAFSDDRVHDLSPHSYGGLGYRSGAIGGGRAQGRAARMETEEVSDMASNAPGAAPKAFGKSAMADKDSDSRMASKAALQTEKSGGGALKLDAFKQKTASSPASPAAAPAPEVAVRSDFRETAFWLPHLLSAKDGTVSVEFDVPDSVTQWSVLATALSSDMSGGVLSSAVKTIKDLLIRPNMPRFLRESDEAKLAIVVNNNSKEKVSGDVSFVITEGADAKSVHALFGLRAKETKIPFSIEGGKSQTLSLILHAPKQVGLYDVTVKAVSKNFTDGEKRPLAVLPSREHLFQSRFVALKGRGEKTVHFDDLARAAVDGSKTSESMVVTVDGQLFYQSLKALPYLWQYPYECVEQTLNRFLPTAIMAKIYQSDPSLKDFAKASSKRKTQWDTFDKVDPNRKILLEETPFLWAAKGGLSQDDTESLINMLDPKVVEAQKSQSMSILKKAQNGDGGFPWWPGGPSEPYMTLYFLAGLSKAAEFGIDLPKDMTSHGWTYLARELDRVGWPSVEVAPEFYVWLAFVYTSYPDSSYHADAIGEDRMKHITDIGLAKWRQFSPYTKSYLTLLLKRRGLVQQAKMVFDSVMDSSKTDDTLGTYWAPEDRSWLWYRDAIEAHAWALRTLMELDPKDPRGEGMVQWIFLNKKLNQWKSTRATAETLYSLAYYMKTHALLGVAEKVSVEIGKQKKVFEFSSKNPTEFRQQWVLGASEIDGKTMSEVKFSKASPGINFASVTWHFGSDELAKESSGDFMNVTRSYYKRVLRGKEFVLEPIGEGAIIRVGDELEVQLSLRSKHEAEYVQLRDPRAAGFEPVTLTSGYKWDLGLYWYEEVRDQATNFFFSRLPMGEYTFNYRVRASMAGKFRVLSATLQSMYAPEFGAYSAGAKLDVQ